MAAIVDYSIGSSGNCGRSFRSALKNNYTAGYAQVADARIVQVITGSTVVDVPLTSVMLPDDDQDITSKAIGGYNRGESVFGSNLSWAEILKRYSLSPAGANNAIESLRKAVEYSLRVKETAGFERRNYNWMVTENRTPQQNDPWQATSFTYCFMFGESDWGRESFLVNAARTAARQTAINTQGGTTACP